VNMETPSMWISDLLKHSLSDRRRIFDAMLEMQGSDSNIGLYRYRWIIPVRFSCPCCGFPTLTGRGLTEICPLCEWRDDGRDNKEADACPKIGCNVPWSLAKARSNFEKYGCMYDPDARYYSQFNAHQHSSLIAAKSKLIQAFMRLITVEPNHSSWNEYWLEVLRCTQDVIYVVGRAREKNKAKRKIVRVRFPEDTQPWIKESPGPAACLRSFESASEKTIYPNEAFSRCADYLDQLEKNTLTKQQYDMFIPRLLGWISFLATACYELHEGRIGSFNGLQEEVYYISKTSSERTAIELLSLTELDNNWFNGLNDDLCMEFVRAKIRKATNLMGELVDGFIQ